MWYSIFQGLMYGTRSAIFMDVTNPRVAATQFTAYMAMMNLAIAIAASWQGIAVEAWGYPMTLLVDAITGVLCVLLLPALKRSSIISDALAIARTRKSALVLGLLCLLWLPYWANHELMGKAQPIMGTFYTLVFVASALFLLAGREILGADAGRWRLLALWAPVPLFAMYGRYFIDKLGSAQAWIEPLLYLFPLIGGVALLGFALQPWKELDRVVEVEPGRGPAAQGAD
jgi:PAT family beta-lactamase induction signal transducer AmpG